MEKPQVVPIPVSLKPSQTKEKQLKKIENFVIVVQYSIRYDEIFICCCHNIISFNNEWMNKQTNTHTHTHS